MMTGGDGNALILGIKRGGIREAASKIERPTRRIGRLNGLLSTQIDLASFCLESKH